MATESTDSTSRMTVNQPEVRIRLDVLTLNITVNITIDITVARRGQILTVLLQSQVQLERCSSGNHLYQV